MAIGVGLKQAGLNSSADVLFSMKAQKDSMTVVLGLLYFLLVLCTRCDVLWYFLL